jgi:hypothetical protein
MDPVLQSAVTTSSMSPRKKVKRKTNIKRKRMHGYGKVKRVEKIIDKFMVQKV